MVTASSDGLAGRSFQRGPVHRLSARPSDRAGRDRNRKCCQDRPWQARQPSTLLDRSVHFVFDRIRSAFNEESRGSAATAWSTPARFGEVLVGVEQVDVSRQDRDPNSRQVVSPLVARHRPSISRRRTGLLGLRERRHPPGAPPVLPPTLRRSSSPGRSSRTRPPAEPGDGSFFVRRTRPASCRSVSASSGNVDVRKPENWPATSSAFFARRSVQTFSALSLRPVAAYSRANRERLEETLG